MDFANSTLFILGLVLFFGLLVPEFFKKLHLPFATAIILLGAFLGPNGLNYIQSNDSTLQFFGYLGAAFLLLLAGLNAKAREFGAYFKESSFVAIFNGIIPFFLLSFTVWFFGYSFETSLLIGIIGIASSAGLSISVVHMLNLERTKAGKVAYAATIFQDIVSMLLITLIFNDGPSRFSFPIYLGLILSSVVILRLFLPELVLYFFKRIDKYEDDMESSPRAVIAVMLVVIFLYTGLGIYPMVAAFFVGVALADIINSKTLLDKLHTLGYGIFVPVFFFIVGTEMNLDLLTKLDPTNILILTFVITAIGSKLFSGYIAGKILRLNNYESMLLGSISLSKLTTTLSVAYAAKAINLIDETLLTAIILVSLLSTVISPLLSTIFRTEEVVDSVG